MIDIGVCKELSVAMHKYDKLGFWMYLDFNKYGLTIHAYWNILNASMPYSDKRTCISAETYKFNRIYTYDLLESILKNSTIECLIDELIKEFTAELNKKGEDLVWWN